MEKTTKTLGKWLISRDHIDNLKIQLLLFLLRVEELINNNTKGSYFKDKDNFQAWIWGPINVDSYWYLENQINKSIGTKPCFMNEKEQALVEKNMANIL